jgi:hypothetical protein
MLVIQGAGPNKRGNADSPSVAHVPQIWVELADHRERSYGNPLMTAILHRTAQQPFSRPQKRRRYVRSL